MKIRIARIWAAMAAICLLSANAGAQDLTVAFADAQWTGQGIPEGQQCQRFGGNDPRSPALQVGNIPADADAIVMEFSDRNVSRMDKGGHGRVGYLLNGARQALIPPVPGHTEELPDKFFVVELHRAPGWDKAGAYLPPCSGGRGNDYFIDVKAVKLGDGQEVTEVLSEASIKMATY